MHLLDATMRQETDLATSRFRSEIMRQGQHDHSMLRMLDRVHLMAGSKVDTAALSKVLSAAVTQRSAPTDPPLWGRVLESALDANNLEAVRFLVTEGMVTTYLRNPGNQKTVGSVG